MGARGPEKCRAFVAKEIISKDAPMNVANTRGKNATRRSENSPFQITPDVLSIIPGISSKDPFDDRLKGKDNDVKWRINA